MFLGELVVSHALILAWTGILYYEFDYDICSNTVNFLVLCSGSPLKFV